MGTSGGNPTAALRLIGAILADQHDERAVARHYLSEEASIAAISQLRDTDPAQPVEVASAS